MQKLASLALVPVLLAACRSTPAPGPQLTDDLVVNVRSSAPDGDGPAGWVYAFDRGDRPNLCLYLWQSGKWSLGAETSQGFYGDVLATGQIVDRCVEGLPADALPGSDKVYVVGDVDVWWRDQPLAKGLDAAAPVVD